MASNNQTQPLRVGPSKFSQGGVVVLDRYVHGGGVAIEVYGEEGREYTATVNIQGQDPGENCVWLKGWSENEGVPEALVQAGIVKLTGKTCQTGFAVALHAELTPLALSVLRAVA